MKCVVHICRLFNDSVSSLHYIQHKIIGWLMTLINNELENDKQTNGSGLTEGVIPEFFRRDWGKLRRNSGQTVCGSRFEPTTYPVPGRVLTTWPWQETVSDINVWYRDQLPRASWCHFSWPQTCYSRHTPCLLCHTKACHRAHKSSLGPYPEPGETN
jgi:hypothetical protein